MIRCARCWATAKQVGIWRAMLGGLRDDGPIVCCMSYEVASRRP